MLTLSAIAHALGGNVNGSYVLAPGPGHSKSDRSLRVMLKIAGDDFVVHSFASDDWRECRDYVAAKLGRVWKPASPSRAIPSFVPLNQEEERHAKARELWAAARTDELRQQIRMIYPNLFKDGDAWREAFRMCEGAVSD